MSSFIKLTISENGIPCGDCVKLGTTLAVVLSEPTIVLALKLAIIKHPICVIDIYVKGRSNYYITRRENSIMTQNQLSFQNLQESKRHNLINEGQETRRLNIEEDRSKWQKALGIANAVINGVTGIGKVVTRGLTGRR